MRLGTVIDEDGNEVPAVLHPLRGLALASDLTPDLDGDLMSLLGPDCQRMLSISAESAPDRIFRDPTLLTVTAPYRRPRKIWGIGLNYAAHAGDLGESVPTEPASFIKGDHTIIGPGDPIPIPRQSNRTTSEAELGLVIGTECYQVDIDSALDYVAGVCPVLDQTAEDILERNPRFLTRSKNFPGFFSFGPWIVPLADLQMTAEGLRGVTVSTVLNGRVQRSNIVANMTFDPAFLVSFHSQVMPLFPGDIISSGTPGAVRLTPGDVAECRITGIGSLSNPVTNDGPGPPREDPRST